jgi:hypothetical protein
MGLMLFNWFGYRLVSAVLESSADSRLEASISLNQYDETDLLRFTVPLNLPYQITDHEFKAVRGEITIEGKIYSYVKRQIINDSLTVLCLPNYAKTKLTEARHNYFSTTADADQHKQTKSKQSSALKFTVLEADLASLHFLQDVIFLKSASIFNHEDFLIDIKICQLPAEPPETLL